MKESLASKGLLLCLMSAAGCSHLTSDLGPPLPSDPPIAVGRSTLGEVLKSVGVPSRVAASPGGFVFLYEHNEVVENQLGFNVNIPVLQWIKFVYGRSMLEHEAWCLTFDTNRVLQAWGREQWSGVLGSGAAAQIIVTVQSVVDSSQVRRPSSQHDWGDAWLVPLPVSLNAMQSPNDGRFGLEQTTALTTVGQHSLEMIQPLPRKWYKR